MASKKEKEKQMQDKLQIILADLLKDDDNKYCVDCDSKGPRWASWTLGIFLCIRCAGIHRNLGVHISRVKSVNLDSWTPQQVAMMKEIGNSRGRAIYEANLEDNFRRPQNDSSLEQFIRAKYEHKRYIAKEWVAPTPTVDGINEELRRLEQNQNKKRINYVPPNNSPAVKKENPEKSVVDNKPQLVSNKIDLLGLENDPVTDDAFGDFVFAAQSSVTTNKTSNSTDGSSAVVSSAVDDLMGLNLGTETLMSNMAEMNTMAPNLATSTPATNAGGKLDKSSILALYNNTNSSSSGNVMGQMPNSSAWPNMGCPSYQSGMMQSDFQSQNYGGGSSWMIPGQTNNVGTFGVQHNPFFSNAMFSGQTAMPISQPAFPTGAAGSHTQPPNQVLW